MRRSVSMFAVLLAVAGASTAVQAQGPAAPGRAAVPGFGARAGAGMMQPAAFLLAHTGDLQLTDAQVTRLAALARRAAADRKALRASFDSARARMRQMPADSLRRGQRPLAALAPDLQRLRDQRHADFRDALAVLTADQQATLWEMMSAQRAMRAVRAAGLARRPGGTMMRPRVLPRRPLQGAPGAPPVRPED